MLNRIFKKHTIDARPNDDQLKLAAATLMFELIRSDGSVDEIEVEQMKSILQNQFKLDQSNVDDLFEQAKESAEEAISLHSFTREICNHWGNPERVKLLEYLWILAFADQRIDSHERHFVRKIAGLLYLTDNQIINAKERAKNKIQ